MDVQKILNELYAERARIEDAISACISYHLAAEARDQARHDFVALACRAQRTVKYASARQTARASS